MEIVRSMLACSKLPRRFWAEALNTATYLWNRCPTHALEGITPVEMLTGNKPKVGHLKVFGCATYCHVPSDERHKLDSKSRKCIFLGYSENQKGYQLYDVERKRIVNSRDVDFNETAYGFEKVNVNKVQQSHNEQVELSTVELTLRRSTRTRQPPVYYETYVNVAGNVVAEPLTVKQTFGGEDREKLWEQSFL